MQALRDEIKFTEARSSSTVGAALCGRPKDGTNCLSRTFDFDDLKLQTAIQETLQNRGTAYEKDSFARVIALADDEDMQVKRRYCLKTPGNPDIAMN